MIHQRFFDFLTALDKNNTRDWFASHKSTYDLLKAELEKTIEELIAGIAVFDPGIGDLRAKDCLFRIYKDTRFSKDKVPYKTNFGAFFVENGKNSGQAGYYLHIEPGKSFVGGGIYMPPAPVLKKIRDEIYHNYPAFTDIVEARSFKTFFTTISGSRLTRPPKGYESDFEGIEYLKYKDFTMIHPVSDEFLKKPDALKKVLDIYKAMKPFNHYLNRSLEA